MLRLIWGTGLLAVAFRSNFEISHEQQIHNIKRIIRLIHYHGTAARSGSEKLAMLDQNGSAIGKMQNKWAKGFASYNVRTCCKVISGRLTLHLAYV